MIGVIGSGQVAQHVVAVLEKRGIPFYLFTRQERLPLERVGVFVSYNKAVLPGLMDKHKIDLMINCSALRDIAVCDRSPALAFEANVELAKIIGDKVRQVYIGTDYVFDQNRDNRVLDEEAKSLGSLSVYGATKLLGEEATLERGGIVTRISSPWGKFASPMKPHFVDFVVMQTAKLELPNDQFFRPTYLPDVAETLVDLGADRTSTGIYHLVNEGKTNWQNFAITARSLRKNKGAIVGVERNDKTRPVHGALVNTRLPKFRNWMYAMQEYLGGKLAEEGIKR